MVAYKSTSSNYENSFFSAEACHGTCEWCFKGVSYQYAEQTCLTCLSGASLSENYECIICDYPCKEC